MVRPSETRAYRDDLESDGRLTVRSTQVIQGSQVRHWAQEYRYSLTPPRDSSVGLFPGNHNHPSDHRLNLLLPLFILHSYRQLLLPPHQVFNIIAITCRNAIAVASSDSERLTVAAKDLVLICSITCGYNIHTSDSGATCYTNTDQRLSAQLAVESHADGRL